MLAIWLLAVEGVAGCGRIVAGVGSNATFQLPDLDAFGLLDRLGLTVTGQILKADHAVLECRVIEPDD